MVERQSWSPIVRLAGIALLFLYLFPLFIMSGIGAVSLWTPFLEPLYMARWFAFPQILYTAPVPLLVVACAYALLRGLNEGRELSPFLAAQSLFLLSYIGIGISFYPYIVPPSLSIWQAMLAVCSSSLVASQAASACPSSSFSA